jgi:hypothetical protein
MAERLIVPGHIADLRYVIPAIKTYADADDWLTTSDYIEQEFKILRKNGVESYMKSDLTDYTKDAELARYFGFVERKIKGNIQSECRITALGKAFFSAYEANDTDSMLEAIMIALETITFGRNNDGCPNSNSRLEAPNILLISALLLDGVTRQEYASILYRMLNGSPISNAITHVKICRLNGSGVGETIRVDNKVIPFLVSMGFLSDDNRKLNIPQPILLKYSERISNLRPTNDEINIFPENVSLSDMKTENEFGPLQQIFYGAPGTGKSKTIKDETHGKSVVRTTFHPDSDYSTFVGAYKPTMDDVDTKVVPVVVNNGISLVNAGTYKEKKIVYKFIPQAFLKAYLGAWKKFADRATRTSVPLAHTFKINDGEYTITGVNTNDISFHRVFPFNISHSSVGRAWNEIWATGSFVIPTGAQPGVSVQQAIAQWIYDNVQNCTKQSLEEGLETLKKSIEEKGQVPISRSSQIYTLSKKENGYFIDTDGKCSKTKIQDYYNGNEPESGARGLQRYFANLLKDIDSSSFENAWTRLADAVNKNTDKVDLQAAKSVLEPQFLVIEEINRGNCAQIFGDLFQLLDRSDNGFSEYPIEADTDLQQEIERAFKEGEYKLTNDINIEGEIEGYTSNYGATLSDDVQSGRVLLLPKNLFIWATMNTSDQSLFPIDSAFKRRWDWKYIKIKNHLEENYKIVVGEEERDWYEFIDRINEIIASMTSSADKQLGYFFCKADKDGKISAKTFVSKVIFYLWNDVFKDYGFEDTSLFRYVDEEDGKEKDLTFPDFYEEDGEGVNETRLKDFLDKVMNWKKDKEEQK